LNNINVILLMIRVVKGILEYYPELNEKDIEQTLEYAEWAVSEEYIELESIDIIPP